MGSFIKIFPNQVFADVLIFFLLHPDEEIYQSRIVKSTQKALMQVQRALKRLEEIGLISKKHSGNRVYYHANRNHPAFEDIKRALLKTEIVGDLLKKSLNELENKIQYGFIYGSLAKGLESAESDIYLFLVGDLKTRDIAGILGSLRDELAREINPTVYPLSELNEKLKQKNPFILEVIQNPKIWLIGNEDIFEEMVRRGTID